MNNKFDDLWEQFLSDKLSEEEWKEFQHLLATEDPQIPEAIDQLLMEKELNGLAPAGREKALLDRILSAAPRSRSAAPDDLPATINSQPAVINSEPAAINSEPAIIRFISSRRNWAAAVILFLVAGSIGYWVSRNRPHPALTNTAAKNDLPPGHSGAILTLSNGKEIVLDSAANGIVASDNQVKVVKKGGEIAYEGKAAEVVYNNVSTPKGRQWQLALSDGTKVWLNAQSSIRYPVSFMDKERSVEVTGEVYFEVAHNDRTPFIVRTPRQEIEVLGTHFNVNVYEDEPILKTTVLEGSVKVSANGKSLIIRPGEQVTNNYAAGELKVKETDVDDEIAWINGRFKFDHSDIRTVMRQIARWYDVDIEYQGDLPDYEFAGGTFRNNQLSEVLHVLEVSGLRFKVANRKIIVMK